VLAVQVVAALVELLVQTLCLVPSPLVAVVVVVRQQVQQMVFLAVQVVAEHTQVVQVAQVAQATLALIPQ
jgi:hypothetical protein